MFHLITFTGRQLVSRYGAVVMFHGLAVGIATGYRLDDQMIGVRFLAMAGNFSLQHHVQTGSGAHPASYPRGTGNISMEVKAAGA
jgi:hypothetical protein